MTHPRRPAVFDEIHPARVPVLRHFFCVWRWLRRRLSRRHFSIWLLQLPVSTSTSDQPGLVLLQIDGLAHAELRQALNAGRMPFLRRLLRAENYRLLPMYSGQPATTPAVLAELFYGVPQAVPAFSFRDHRTGEVVEMVQPSIASVIQASLESGSAGLLAGGSAYCDIYSGGAAESHFCPGSMGWSVLREAAVWRKAAIYLLNGAAVFRMIDQMMFDLGHALVDALTSRVGRREFLHELKFLPRRLIGGIALRDLVAIAAETDTTRGLPVLHANFVGYDELAHRRGPGSAYAHRGLPAIDRALQRIWKSAHASVRRDYHVWIMADHGQEPVTPYSQLYGPSITDAVGAFYRQTVGGPDSSSVLDNDPAETPLVVAVGPLGFVYWPRSLSTDELEEVGARLAHELQIPIVMTRTTAGTIAWSHGQRWRMPDDAAHILGRHHPHLSEVADDFARLTEHPDAGHFVICGFRRNGESVSFVSEHGAHGGPGPQETTGFLLLPAEDAPRGDRPLRPGTVRDMGRELLQQVSLRTARSRKDVPNHATVKIVTYNVHSCIGLDGRLSPGRIARVLAALDPDVIALQELDVCRLRSGCIDQAQAIAAALGMDLHFLPCFEITGEKYGNAVLSRLPMHSVRAHSLPARNGRCEPRGAVWVQIDCHAVRLNLVATHLSFDPHERRLQVDALLGPQWLEDPRCSAPVVVCGDFNAGPRSDLYRRITRRLRDAQLAGPSAVPQRTWFSPWPLARIDHVFLSPDLGVKSAGVAKSSLSRVASDHLPVAVEILLPVTAAPPHDGDTADQNRHAVP